MRPTILRNSQSGFATHLRFPQVGSTQTWATDHLPLLVREHGLGQPGPSGNPGWVVVSAEQQTSGIGTTDTSSRSPRVWDSPTGNVYATFVIPWPRQKAHMLLHFAQVATVAVSRTLETYGFNPTIKWINDVLIDGRKISGVICNSPSFVVQDRDESVLEAVLVGIGINVCFPRSRQDLVSQPITCMAWEMQRMDGTSNSMCIKDEALFNKCGVEPLNIIEALCKHMQLSFKTLNDEGFKPFLGYINERLLKKGEEITISQDGPLVERGILSGLNSDGSLVLKLSDGTQKTFMTGHIVK